MLDGLRKYATSWYAQLLMGLLVLSFAAWGVNDVFNGFRSNDIAEVGGSSITVVDFQRDYDLAVRDLSQRLGQSLTPEQARQFGVPGQILGRLVNQATLDNAASKMGVGVSDQQLAKQIADDPRFVGSSGTFDRQTLNETVQSMGFTPDTYIVSERQNLARGQIAQALAGGITAPTAYLSAVHEYQAEERDVSYVVLTAPPATDIADPSETDLSTYFDAQKDLWKAPELRAVSYFALTPADIAKTEDVSDADAQQAYDAQKARFETPEKRQVEQIVFKDHTDADQAAASLAGGKTFDQLMVDRNLKPADVTLGLVTKDKIIDPAVATVAFGLAPNSVSPVVDGQFGPVILRVTTVQPAVVTSFEDAKADLKKQIAEQRAATEVSATHDAIEDARAGGGTLAEIAAKYDLKVVIIPAVDSQGKDADGNAIADLPSGLIPAAFESDVGLDNDPIQPDRNSFLWYGVTAKTAPHERTLSEVHDKVVAAWKDSEREKRLADKADAAKQRLDNKEDIAKVAGDLGVQVKQATKLTRDAKPTADLSAAALTAIFAASKGSGVVADGVDPMSRVVAVVDNVTVPDFSETAPDVTAAKQTLDGQFITSFLGLYVNQLQAQTKVTFNQVALQQVLGATDTAN